jgi:hypothetical protein
MSLEAITPAAGNWGDAIAEKLANWGEPRPDPVADFYGRPENRIYVETTDPNIIFAQVPTTAPREQQQQGWQTLYRVKIWLLTGLKWLGQHKTAVLAALGVCLVLWLAFRARK